MASRFPYRRITIAGHWGRVGLSGTLRRLRAAEEAGFSGVWAGEGATGSDAFATLAYYAAHSTTIGLGTAVALWTRTPASMAATAQCVHDLSGGRFTLGMGTMPKVWSQNWHGIDATRVVGRMSEYIRAIRACWDRSPGEPVTFEGEFYQIREFPGVDSRSGLGRPKIALAVTMPQMCRLAGRVGDAVMFHFIHTVPFLRDVSLPAVQGGLEATGRTFADLEVIPSILVCLGDDRARLLGMVKARIAMYLPFHYVNPIFDHHGLREERERALRCLQAGDTRGVAEAIPDEFAEMVAVIGSLTEARRRLAEYADFADAPRIQLMGDDQIDDVERFYSEVYGAIGQSPSR